VRVLLDECVDARLAASLNTVDVRTVADRGWVGISNGQLLALAAAEFDVFVTVDRNLPFQQHLPKFDIAVILLRAKSNRIADLVALAPELIAALRTAKKGVVTPAASNNRVWTPPSSSDSEIVRSGTSENRLQPGIRPVGELARSDSSGHHEIRGRGAKQLRDLQRPRLLSALPRRGPIR